MTRLDSSFLRAILRRSRVTTTLVERVSARRHRRPTFSQFGEDAFLLGYYDRLRVELDIDVSDGLVVDVGGYRPILYSNSFTFHQQGWRCINIDPDPTSVALFDAVRPEDVNVCAAVGPEAGAAAFHVFGSPSVWNTLDAAKAASVARRLGQTPTITEVEVRTLDSILDEHAGASPFEVLLIDAEGFDEMILRTCDLDRWRPRIVVMEAHATEAAHVTATPIVGHMLRTAMSWWPG